MSGVHKLVSVELDTVTLPAATAEIEHERRVAIFDLVEKNSFEPVGAPDDAEGGGRYRLKLSLQDNRLVFDIDGGGFTRTYAISLTPLKGVLRDYLMICDSYYEALRGSSASQIESVDIPEGQVSLDPQLNHTLKEVVNETEKAYLEQLLSKFKGSITETAKHSDVDTRTIHRKLKEYGIKKEIFKM